MTWRRLDESDVRLRPNRRGSRPRTKERPAYDDAVTGFVVTVDRGRYTCLVEHLGAERAVVAVRSRALGRGSVVVGDDVDLVGDTSGAPDALARIVRVHERRSTLRRTADDDDPVERVLVANAEQLAVVCSLADPPPRSRLVDRCLVAAFDAGLDPLLVLTKADLADPAQFLAGYAALDVPWLVTSRVDGRVVGLDALAARLTGRVSVLVGHSGVGKSTLVNALVPGSDRATAAVNPATGRGRHTSSSAVALRLPRGQGWVIDTPGVRSFGLAHVASEQIITHFRDLLPGAAECPRGCSHDEPDCALDAFVARGGAGSGGAARLESLRRLLRARPDDPFS